VTVDHADRNLEVVLLPVSDVDRSEEFHKGLRRREDADTVTSDDLRLGQLTGRGRAPPSASVPGSPR
jgi:hypothetical protein